VDDRGRPARGWAALLPAALADVEALAALRHGPARTKLELTAAWAGEGFLFAVPEEPGLVPVARAPVRIPARVDVTVDLGELRFERGEARSLRVLGVPGGPRPGVLRVFRDGCSVEADLGADGSVAALLATQLREGDRVLVELDAPEGAEAMPRYETLAGPGPWTIRVPAGELRVTVTDPHGARVPWLRVVVDDAEEFGGSDGEVHVVAVPPGRRRLLLTAAGRQARAVEVTVRAGERAEVAVTLAAAPGK
jgi:hypothetical protein